MEAFAFFWEYKIWENIKQQVEVEIFENNCEYKIWGNIKQRVEVISQRNVKTKI